MRHASHKFLIQSIKIGLENCALAVKYLAVARAERHSQLWLVGQVLKRRDGEK